MSTKINVFINRRSPAGNKITKEQSHNLRSINMLVYTLHIGPGFKPAKNSAKYSDLIVVAFKDLIHRYVEKHNRNTHKMKIRIAIPKDTDLSVVLLSKLCNSVVAPNTVNRYISSMNLI